ncbi:MAG: flagellar filament capping protein FliD [Actinomycetota bacterium]|nr:flagellar filament capping protein FliD [Actinomycetota bacterium]
MSGVTSTGAATGPSLVVNGLVSGITTPKVIQALLQAYQVPITNLEQKQTGLKAQQADYRAIASALQAVQTAAQALNTSSQWALSTATSSDTAVASAVAGTSAQTGSLTFTVDQLAQANVLASSGGVATVDQVVTSAKSILVATGAPGIGFSDVTAGTGLALGSYTVTVTHASAAASVTGKALGSTVTIGATATLNLKVDGATKTVTIAAGSYTASSLATAVTSAAASAGAAVQAAAGPTGGLVLSTDRQGATASLAVTGGSALTALGLAATQSAIGADAVVTVGGVTTTLSSITPGSPVTLHVPGGGTIKATVATAPGLGGALVRAGTAHAVDVTVGNGSLSSVVSAINGAGLHATASTVQLASGNQILQVLADGTGTAGAVTVGSGAFSGSPLGSLRTITAAQNAQVSVGGANGYTLSSATDTFTNLLQGTTVTVSSAGQATVTVKRDATGEASRVQSLVTAANKALGLIQRYAGYTTSTKRGGPLMGDAVITDLRQQIISTVASTTGSSSLANLADVGVSLVKTGTLSFTPSKFVNAFDANPTAVADLFVQGGSYTPSAAGAAGEVSFAFAGTQTVAGSYKVVVSHSATQATDTGGTLATKAVGTAETLTVTAGTASATYSTTAGESLTAVAAGLNAAFAGAKLTLTARVVTAGATGAHLQIVSDAYGSSVSFTVTSTASGAGTTGLAGAAAFTGTNVAGTIGGVAATGNGQVLSAPTGSGPASGLGVLVAATGITTTTTLGSMIYRPGVAQSFASAMAQATNSQTGSITSAIKGLVTQATNLSTQIARYQHLESEQRAVLQRTFVTMETNLAKLQNENSMLTSQISKLPATG